MSDDINDATLDGYQSSPNLSSQPDSEFDDFGTQIVADLGPDDFDLELNLSTNSRQAGSQIIPPSFPGDRGRVNLTFQADQSDNQIPTSAEGDGNLRGGEEPSSTAKSGPQIQGSRNFKGETTGTGASINSMPQKTSKSSYELPLKSSIVDPSQIPSNSAQRNRVLPSDITPQSLSTDAAPVLPLQPPATVGPSRFGNGGRTTPLPSGDISIGQQPSARPSVRGQQPKPVVITLDGGGDDDEEVIFLSSRTRKDLQNPGQTIKIKTEPRDDDHTQREVRAEEATLTGDRRSLGPGNPTGSSGHSVRDLPRKSMTGKGVAGTPSRTPDVEQRSPNSDSAAASKGITLRSDIIKRVQANMMARIKESTLATRAGAGTLFGTNRSDLTGAAKASKQNNVDMIRQGQASSSQETGFGKTVKAGTDAMMLEDDEDMSWMTQQIDEDEDGDIMESIENTSLIEGRDDDPHRAWKNDVESIRAKTEMEVRKRRREMAAEVNSPEVEDEGNSIFVPDVRENVHKQRQRAAESSQRFKTPFNVRDEEVEEFDFDGTAGRDKRQKTGNDASKSASGRHQSETQAGWCGGAEDTDASMEVSEEPRSRTRALSEDRVIETDAEIDEIPDNDSHALAKLSQQNPKKKRGPRAKTAKESFLQRQRTADATAALKAGKNPKPRKAPKGGKQGDAAKGKAKAAPKKPAKSKATRKTSKKKNGQTDEREEFLHGLFFNDAIKQRMEQGDFGVAPRIQESKSKDRMLKELMASVPKEHKRLVTNDKTQVLKASKNFGYGNVTAKEGKWLLKGMQTSLYHHQLLGADWMIGREFGGKEKGGILADAMGLGKTLQMLAVMVANKPDPKAKAKPTLLVVPSSVIEQWLDEIRKHVVKDYFPEIIHYKKSKDISATILQHCDVIITSYAELVAGFPYPSKKKEKDLLASEITDLEQRTWPERGPLHQISFHRVVLDEAHVIKNHKGKTALACCKLNAVHRWALSGTPIQNRIEEVFSYFRFLGVEYTEDYHQFRREFCDPDSEDCSKRLVMILSTLMIRRTLKDKMFNRPIVELPCTFPNTKRIDFSREERCLYEIIEDRFRTDFNLHLKKGTAVRNYRNFMVKLLRLRQLTAHPFLIEQTIRDVLTLDDLRKLEAKLNRLDLDDRPLYEKLGQWVRERTEAHKNEELGFREEDELEELRAVVSKTREFGRSNYGTSFPLEKYLNTLDEQEMLTRCICQICHDIATDPQITDCHHVFCRACIEDVAHSYASLGSDFSACPTCESVYDHLIPWFDLTAKEAAASPQSTRGCGDEDSNRKDDKKRSWLSMEGEILPSAKTIALKAQMLEWVGKAPKEKIVIFTQFRLMGKIIGKFCKAEGWGVVYFTGEMDGKARSKAVKIFNDDPKTNIMIAGLKCGGQGLNLTMACRVVCIDLWWNHSVEQQAFGRVFRIGQQNQTYLMRFVVRGTVDDRLLNMQEEKSRVVDYAMMDDGRTVPQLSVEELASLFGYLTEDEDGNKVILPEYERASGASSGSQVEEEEA